MASLKHFVFLKKCVCHLAQINREKAGNTEKEKPVEKYNRVERNNLNFSGPS